MTIDWASVWEVVCNAAAWILTHPAEVTATVSMVAGWFGIQKKLKEDASAARDKLRLERLRMVGELAYGKAAWQARKADGTRVNKLAAALDSVDEYLRLLSEEPTSSEEKKLLTGIFTATHERETLAAAPPPPAESIGC